MTSDEGRPTPRMQRLYHELSERMGEPEDLLVFVPSKWKTPADEPRPTLRHVLANPGRIPHFPGCAHLLLHPRFTEEGFDTIDDEDGLVKILYVVPITSHERQLLLDHGRVAFVDHLIEHDIDRFADRRDP